MPGPLRLGILGAGSIGIRGVLAHLSIGDFAGRVTAAAVCDVSPGRAAAAAARFGVPEAYESLEEMLALSDCDAVTICTPIDQHFAQGMAVIASGRHVHFNKTMTTTCAEADEIIRAAAGRGLRMTASPGQMLRPHLRRIRDLISAGAIGRPTWAVAGAAFGTYHELEGVRQGDDPLSNVNPAWYWRRAGGGPLYDMTVYGLHALTGILGPARRVAALSGIVQAERVFRGETYVSDCDDNTLFLLDFGDALFAFCYGTAAGSIVPMFGSPTFYGTQGCIAGDRLNGEPFEFAGRELQAERGINAVLPDYNDRHPTEEFHVFQDILQLADLVKEGRPAACTPEHARHVIEIIEKAYLSSESGSTLDLVSTFER